VEDLKGNPKGKNPGVYFACAKSTYQNMNPSSYHNVSAAFLRGVKVQQWKEPL